MSVYCSPLTIELTLLSPKSVLNVWPTSLDVELAEGSYNLCPLQVELQSEPGRIKSLLPVSNCTECCPVTNLATMIYHCLSGDLPVKVTAGVPTVMAPYQIPFS